MVVGSLRREHRDRLDSVAQTVAAARFCPPPGFQGMKVHTIGTSADARSPWPFPREVSRALIVSPFLTRSFLERFPSDWAQTCVVSRGDEMDRELIDRAPDAATVAAPDDAHVPRSGFFYVNPSVVDEMGADESALSGLHAKLFVVDQAGGESRVFSGSANATAAAFEKNVEVLVEMVGRTKDVGVATFLGPDGLRPLLLTHAFTEGVSDADGDPVCDHLDHVRHALGGAVILADVTPADDGRFDVRYRSVGTLPALGDAHLEVRPLTVAAWSAVTASDRLDHRLTVDEAGISGFLAVRLTEGRFTQTMLLAATLTGIPDGRDERIMADLLADPVRLIRYLMMLLLDRPEDRFDGAAQDAVERSRHATHATLETVPLLEVMARALLGSRSRLREVDRLLRELEVGSSLVDKDLHDLWDSMRNAAGLAGDRA